MSRPPSFHKAKITMWDWETAEWVKTLAAETEDLSSTPVTDSFKSSSDLHMHTIHKHTTISF